jgi:hypothetical protein
MRGRLVLLVFGESNVSIFRSLWWALSWQPPRRGTRSPGVGFRSLQIIVEARRQCVDYDHSSVWAAPKKLATSQVTRQASESRKMA